MRGFVVVAATAVQENKKKTVYGGMEVSLGQVFIKHD